MPIQEFRLQYPHFVFFWGVVAGFFPLSQLVRPSPHAFLLDWTGMHLHSYMPMVQCYIGETGKRTSFSLRRAAAQVFFLGVGRGSQLKFYWVTKGWHEDSECPRNKKIICFWVKPWGNSQLKPAGLFPSLPNFSLCVCVTYTHPFSLEQWLITFELALLASTGLWPQLLITLQSYTAGFSQGFHGCPG